MKKVVIAMLLLISAFTVRSAFADNPLLNVSQQQKEVKGVVVDTNGEHIQGVSVFV